MAIGRIRTSTGILALTGTLLAAFFLLLSPAPGANAATWTVKGGGFGHGVGMSSYGSYGMAEHGWSYRKILRHYYQHTRVRDIRKSHVVRVLLSVDPGNAYFSGAERACGVTLNPQRTYGAKLHGTHIRLIRNNGKKLANCGTRLRTDDGGKVVFEGIGRYRGAFEAVASETAGSLNVVNAVDVNAYVKGVIPNEAIPSWPMEALKVQAVAARSIALTGGVGGNGFDLYNDTRSQVYGGFDTELHRTNKAASDTSNEVVSYKGKVALAMFSASSGGHTENVENVFYSSPVPYLEGVKDPYDDVSPYHRWVRSYSSSEMNSLLGGYVDGRLKKVVITKYGVSKRIVWARLYGTGGVTKIRGDSFEYALGLLDKLVFSVERHKGSAGASSASASGTRAAKGSSRPTLYGSGTILPSADPSTAPATTSEG